MINENQYRLLCELTDKLLNVDGVKTERVAISMLHVMRAHPIFLSRYESLFVDLNILSYRFKNIELALITCKEGMATLSELTWSTFNNLSVSSHKSLY